MRITKKILVAALLVGSLVALADTARAATPGGSLQTYEIGPSTASGTFVLLDSGAGWVYDVIMSSGAAGTYAVCYDSASVSGLTLDGFGTSAAPQFPPAFIVQVGTVTIGAANWPRSAQQFGIGYGNGLACAQSSSGRTYVLWKEQ